MAPDTPNGPGPYTLPPRPVPPQRPGPVLTTPPVRAARRHRTHTDPTQGRPTHPGGTGRSGAHPRTGATHITTGALAIIGIIFPAWLLSNLTGTTF